MNIFQRAIHCGYSCLPCKGKIPVISWKKYITEIPTFEEAENWSGNIGIICGAISGGLTCIDFDIKNGDRWNDWLYEVDKRVPHVLSKLYVQKTPSGGYHAVFRSYGQYSNEKLAINKDGMAMIETRGEGGYFMCAPSVGYSVYYGKLSGLDMIDAFEAHELISACKVFSDIQIEEQKPKKKQFSTIVTNSPFDLYDSSNGVYDTLIKFGWKLISTRGDIEYYSRPGKSGGVSATFNAIPNRFYCFTSSTSFEVGNVYKPSAVYAILECDGDYKKAAKQIKENI